MSHNYWVIISIDFKADQRCFCLYLTYSTELLLLIPLNLNTWCLTSQKHFQLIQLFENRNNFIYLSNSRIICLSNYLDKMSTLYHYGIAKTILFLLAIEWRLFVILTQFSTVVCHWRNFQPKGKFAPNHKIAKTCWMPNKYLVNDDACMHIQTFYWVFH